MTNKSKLLLLTSVSPIALALGGGAYAADLPVKAAPHFTPPPPAYSWTGCYVGGHVGYGWGKQDATHTGTFASIGGSASGSGSYAGSAGINTHGGVYGGQVGCNYQFASNWVFGVEAMLAGSNLKGDVADPIFFEDRIGVKTDYFGSAVARLGFTTNNNTLLWYGKAGLAGAHNKWNYSWGSGGLSGSEAKLGWTIGAGLEWAFSPKWSTFVDYSYYDFGKTNNVINDSYAYTCGIGCGGGGTDNIASGRMTMSVVKVGINYKFIP